MLLTDIASPERWAPTTGVLDGTVYYQTINPLQARADELMPPWAQVFVSGLEQAAENLTLDGGIWLCRHSLWSLVCVGGVVLLAETPEFYFEPREVSEPAGPRTLTPHLDALHWMKTATGLPHERLGRLVGVTRQSLHAWENGSPITDNHRRRVLGVRDVLERAARSHANAASLATWLDTPRGADGRTPAEVLEAGDLERARLLAVTAPDPGVRPPPSWTARPLPSRFRPGKEPRQAPVAVDRDEQLFALFGEPGSESAADDEESTAR